MHEIYERVVHWDGEGSRMENITPTSDKIAKKVKRTKAPFRETFLFQLVEHISQASKIGLSVIAVDCVTFFVRMMGYSTDILKNVPRIYSKVVYTGWITHRLQLMKRHFLEKTLVKSYGTLMIHLYKFMLCSVVVCTLFSCIWLMGLSCHRWWSRKIECSEWPRRWVTVSRLAVSFAQLSRGPHGHCCEGMNANQFIFMCCHTRQCILTHHFLHVATVVI